MISFKIIIYPTLVLLGALAIFAYRTVNKTFKKYRKYGDIKTDPEWEGFIRKDFNQWD